MAWIKLKKGQRRLPMLDGTMALLSEKPIEVPDHYAVDLAQQDENVEIVADKNAPADPAKAIKKPKSE